VFVHEGLRGSAWCDQEIGWLLGRNVPVMALRFDGTPYGLFAKHQAQPVPKNATSSTIAEMVVDRIASKPELAGGFAASLVSAMSSSPNFATTESIWKRLRELSSLDADLCSQLLEATKKNNQIFWANCRWDGGEPYPRVVTEFLRRQPGAAVIASDIQAYVDYLDEQDAEDGRAAGRNAPPLRRDGDCQQSGRPVRLTVQRYHVVAVRDRLIQGVDAKIFHALAGSQSLSLIVFDRCLSLRQRVVVPQH
jgi:hypothetical protein